MMALTKDADLLLVRAIRRRWPDRRERAKALELSTRQLNRWELDGHVPGIIGKLIEVGVIAIVEMPPADDEQGIAA